MKQPTLSDDAASLLLAVRRIQAREHAARLRRANPGWLQRLFKPRAKREHTVRIGTLTIHNNLLS